MNNKIALDWRLRGERYRLEAVACSHCGKVHFPPRAICSECGQPMNGLAEVMNEHIPERDVTRAPSSFIRREKREPALAEA